MKPNINFDRFVSQDSKGRLCLELTPEAIECLDKTGKSFNLDPKIFQADREQDPTTGLWKVPMAPMTILKLVMSLQPGDTSPSDFIIRAAQNTPHLGADAGYKLGEVVRKAEYGIQVKLNREAAEILAKHCKGNEFVEMLESAAGKSYEELCQERDFWAYIRKDQLIALYRMATKADKNFADTIIRVYNEAQARKAAAKTAKH